MNNKELYKYIDQYKSSFDPDLLRLQRETHLKTLAPQMSSGPVQGRLLELISKMIGPKYILEVGTFTGFATLCLAKGLAKDGIITTIDPNKEVGHLATKYFDKSLQRESINQIFGDAKEIIPTLPNGIDLVFLDADKENYLNYYEMLIPKMESGGVLLADNILWYGKVWSDHSDKRTVVLHEFNKRVSSDDRVENIILPIRDGVNLIRKK